MILATALSVIIAFAQGYYSSPVFTFILRLFIGGVKVGDRITLTTWVLLFIGTIVGLCLISVPLMVLRFLGLLPVLHPYQIPWVVALLLGMLAGRFKWKD
jgi:hypothetical protein